MAAGFVFYPAEAGGTGHCPASRSNLWRPGSCSIRRKRVEPGTARPPALIYGGRGRVLSGGSGWNRALPGQRKQPGAGSACSVRSGSLMCCAVLHAMQQRLQPPKGPGELAIAPLGPLGTPLPFLTRSCGSVLRKIRSCQASFWWSEGDGVTPTEPRDQQR